MPPHSYIESPKAHRQFYTFYCSYTTYDFYLLTELRTRKKTTLIDGLFSYIDMGFRLSLGC